MPPGRPLSGAECAEEPRNRHCKKAVDRFSCENGQEAPKRLKPACKKASPKPSLRCSRALWNRGVKYSSARTFRQTLDDRLTHLAVRMQDKTTAWPGARRRQRPGYRKPVPTWPVGAGGQEGRLAKRRGTPRPESSTGPLGRPRTGAISGPVSWGPLQLVATSCGRLDLFLATAQSARHTC